MVIAIKIMVKFKIKNIDSLAQRMLDDYDSKKPGMLFAEGLTMNVNEAWQLQIAVADLRIKRGEKPVGYKIGLVSKGNQEMIGMNHPAWGRVWDTEQHADDAQLKKSNYANYAMGLHELALANRTAPQVNYDRPIETFKSAIKMDPNFIEPFKVN